MDQAIIIHNEVKSEREREKKYHKISLTGGIYQSVQRNKTEITSQTSKTNLCLLKKVRKSDKLGLLHYHINTNMYLIDNQKRHIELHRES